MIEASVSWWLDDLDTKGMNDRRFSSRDIQIKNQWDAERASSVLAKRVEQNTVKKGRIEFINL